MRSTTQNVPLLISRVLEYGTTAFPQSEVVTWSSDGPRRTTFAELGRDCRRLANALRELGIYDGQRVGTFMWNNEEHLELYLAVPSMGAVLHTINIRLPPQQMIHTINHAADQIVVVDNSLAEPFSRLLPDLPTVDHVIVNGPVPLAVRKALSGGGKREVHDYHALLTLESDHFSWPEMDENDVAAMYYTHGTAEDPKRAVYSHRSNVLHSTHVAGHHVMALTEASRALVIVPLFQEHAWGAPYAALISGAGLILPDRFLQAEPLVTMIEQERVNVTASVPTIWSDVLSFLDAHPEADISGVERVITGGPAWSPALMNSLPFHPSPHVILGDDAPGISGSFPRLIPQGFVSTYSYG